MAAPKVSVVIPVYNEEAVLPALFARLYPALDALGASYEVIFINDGSVDRSAALLREQFQRRPDATRVILFAGNYGRDIVAAINSCREVNTFIPALAFTFAQRPAEIEVAHEERAAGQSKYSLYNLVRLNFDLVTGFSVMPLQLFSLSGIVIALLSIVFVIFLAVRRLVVGPEAEGVFTLFGLAFFLIGATLFGIGLLGEYVGRIYEQVRQRPRYLVQAVLEKKE